MIKDPERFEKIWAGFQSIVISAAVIIGGIWTWITFKSLKQETKARAELIDLQQKISRQGIIEVQIDVAQEFLPNDKFLYINGTAHIKNLGTRNAVIQFPASGPLTAQKMVTKTDGAFEAVGPALHAKSPTGDSGAVLRVGVTERIPFWFRVDSPGLYLVTFDTDPSEEDRGIAKDAGMPETAAASWSGSRFVVVHPANGQESTCRTIRPAT